MTALFFFRERDRLVIAVRTPADCLDFLNPHSILPKRVLLDLDAGAIRSHDTDEETRVMKQPADCIRATAAVAAFAREYIRIIIRISLDGNCCWVQFAINYKMDLSR